MSCWTATDFKDPVRLSPLLGRTIWQIVRRFASSVWKVGAQSIRSTNQAKDQVPGSSSAPNLEQEFVIGGYIPGTRRFDALLMGVYRNAAYLCRAGKNGFVPRIRDEIFPTL